MECVKGLSFASVMLKEHCEDHPRVVEALVNL